MGIEIDREDFDEAEYGRFADRLEACLAALRALLARPGFGVGAPTVGAELELFLVDHAGRPLAENAAVLDGAGDRRVTLEVDRFNLELNPNPSSLAGRSLGGLGRQMADAVGAVRRAAADHGGRVAMVGILPTLRAEDLHRGAITDSARYRALDKAVLRQRKEPIRVRIEGADPDPVEIVRDDVALEGANTSFQVHLRVDPDRFAATWNAAAMATAPVLAAAGNSPIFLGRRLWAETRVALFEQATDDRDQAARGRQVPRVAFGTGWARRDAAELFEEAIRLHPPLLPLLSEEDPLAVVGDGGLPHLDELRLHNGTVWRWNRPVFDASDGGHVRLELRALPAGPTIVDMLANAAFLLGLILAVAPEAPAWLERFPFARAQANFYRAARLGLDAELDWPAPGGRLERVGAAELARRLLPEAGQALKDAGVDADETGRLLAVVQERLAAGQTGARWQVRTLAALEPRLGRGRALHQLLERYLELSAADRPVHTWPVAA
ncbi:MAG TPA: glutamate-cysteine ligase family protein [Actinomycetes bacterium]|jgi:gamma-glutamyl:cysteine ligase YbdK (ATP-grasp superfamily)|nr:glutamate-cysteine ligase family protein [Actinomycetes bacterium]